MNAPLSLKHFGYVMKMYIFSFGVGILVGVLYYVLNVRSPAPPVVALIGLLGMLVGEQAVPYAKQWLAPSTQMSESQSQNPPKTTNDKEAT